MLSWTVARLLHDGHVHVCACVLLMLATSTRKIFKCSVIATIVIIS